MNCDDFQEMISAGLDGQLSSEETRTLEAHLETCVACREFAEAAGDLCRLSSTEKGELLPSGLEREILRKTSRTERGLLARIFQNNYQIPRPIVWAAAAALLFLTAHTLLGPAEPKPVRPPEVAGSPNLAQEEGVRTIHVTAADMVYRRSQEGGLSNQ